MKSKTKVCCFAFAGLALVFVCQTCFGQELLGQTSNGPSICGGEPNWYPYVLARGDDRLVIQNTPMEDRPYRPLHFYGNTVRRTYYRGTPVPAPRDLARATAVTVRRR